MSLLTQILCSITETVSLQALMNPDKWILTNLTNNAIEVM